LPLFELFADDAKLYVQIVNDIHAIQLQQDIDALVSGNYLSL